MIDALQIHVSIYGLVAKPLGFSQERSIFRNEILAAKHEILGGFSFSCIGIDVTAHQAGRMACDQASSIYILPRCFIAGRTVYNDRSSCQCVTNGRGFGTQASSQTSAAIIRPGMSSQAKIKFVPIGISCPSHLVKTGISLPDSK